MSLSHKTSKSMRVFPLLGTRSVTVGFGGYPAFSMQPVSIAACRFGLLDSAIRRAALTSGNSFLSGPTANVLDLRQALRLW